MYILTSDNNIIQAISETLNLNDFDDYEREKQEGNNEILKPNYLLDIGIYLSNWNISNVYEVLEIPNYITKEKVFGTEKYMYTQEDGFFQNPNWVRSALTTDELQERYDYLLSILTPAQMDAFENEFPEEE